MSEPPQPQTLTQWLRSKPEPLVQPDPPARPVAPDPGGVFSLSASRRLGVVSPGTTAYGHAALVNKAAEMRGVVEGSRNDTLNAIAHKIGRLVAGGEIAREDAERELTAAALSAGLQPGEVRATVESGLTSGMLRPQRAPERDRATPFGVQPAMPLATTPSPEDAEPSGGHAVVTAEPDEPAPDLDALVREHLPRVDWHALWADESADEWVVEPLLPVGRLVALYSAPKVGKSLLMLEIAVGVATGRMVLGVTPDRPRTVLYVDLENDPRGDVRTRLQAMGYGPDDLDRLVYLSFPTLAALDSERGGAELLAAVATYGAEVVVLDTVSRVVQGEENENDTWLAFYRYTGMALKRAGVACVRLDHSGKDDTKGMRGGSAKYGDVDLVWRLSTVVDGKTYRLDLEAKRMQVAETMLTLHREAAPLRHRVDPLGRAAAVDARLTDYLAVLAAAGLPLSAGRPQVVEVLRQHGRKVGTDLARKIVEARQGGAGAVPDAVRHTVYVTADPDTFGTGGDS